MIKVRKAEERGHFDHGWLNTYHTFSFADYYEPEHMGYGHLRVINQDRVQPGEGFGTHGHRDMEIISYVLEGALEHRDSMGNGSVIRPGEVQRMSAGTGVMHSEYNPSPEELVHFLQIWILPERKGLTPGYEQKYFAPAERRGRLRLIASRDGAEGSVTFHQDARVFAGLLGPGEAVDYTAPAGRRTWLQIARGTLLLNSNLLKEGDGAAVIDEASLRITGKDEAELLLFDLA
ncbi:MAG: pirin family protein [Acidobacteriia bacterium]|nr:pirin family protein [Terriglobia bacterium]